MKIKMEWGADEDQTLSNFRMPLHLVFGFVNPHDQHNWLIDVTNWSFMHPEQPQEDFGGKKAGTVIHDIVDSFTFNFLFGINKLISVVYKLFSCDKIT